MKQLLRTGMAMVLLGGMLCGCAAKKEPPTETAPAAAENLHHVEMKVKDYGVMTIELDANAAPLTVENFMSLAEEGFYDGLTFHRIMDGFMIQGGDPSGNGSGGSGTTIPGEFKSNGWDNSISHVTGTISMARAKHPDSASSQFFIMVGDATYLDGNYAAFGHVTDGLDVALQIAADAEPVDDNGTILPEAQPVIEYVKVLD
ncbi:MAG: peptidylprolyl isomerase [Solobacterium sp.]|nr:peptidylprolyl isomerase [Solobacterium sp.]